ncbi:MAG TPA: hypothetical protein VG621_02565 [Candidatus Paceibacterota bacterium]|nr:hypothetical protein [Candidatus Paceibacterota bacterium]
MSKKVKVFAIVVLVISALIAAATFLGNRTPSPSPESPLASSAGSTPAAGVPLSTSAPSEFDTLLSTVKSITIDTSLFTDPGYRALRDHPVALGSDIRGRPNPFATIGYDVGTITPSTYRAADSTSSVQFDTIQPSKVTSTGAEFAAQATLADTSQASVIFEYGTTSLLGSATAPIPLSQNGIALFQVAGLTPSTTYYVRATLVQGSTTVPGSTMTFTTLHK